MTRTRAADLELEIIDEGTSDLNVEDKYPEVKQLIAAGKEKGFLLYDEIYEVLPEEVTSLPEELDEIYIRFNDLGIEVVEDAKLSAPKEITIDGAVEDKEVDQREEVQADIVAAASGVIDKTNDPVRMYLREMGTVKLLDREGEVEIAKRIEKGERRVYKSLSSNRIILEEILKINEAAKTDTKVIKEMIDLATAEDAEYVAPDPPAFLIPGAIHLRHAEPDILERRHVPADVVQPAMGRSDQREHVVVAAVRAVKEGDDGTAAVRQA